MSDVQHSIVGVCYKNTVGVCYVSDQLCTLGLGSSRHLIWVDSVWLIARPLADKVLHIARMLADSAWHIASTLADGALHIVRILASGT